MHLNKSCVRPALQPIRNADHHPKPKLSPTRRFPQRQVQISISELLYYTTLLWISSFFVSIRRGDVQLLISSREAAHPEEHRQGATFSPPASLRSVSRSARLSPLELCWKRVNCLDSCLNSASLSSRNFRIQVPLPRRLGLRPPTTWHRAVGIRNFDTTAPANTKFTYGGSKNGIEISKRSPGQLSSQQRPDQRPCRRTV